MADSDPTEAQGELASRVATAWGEGLASSVEFELEVETGEIAVLDASILCAEVEAGVSVQIECKGSEYASALCVADAKTLAGLAALHSGADASEVAEAYAAAGDSDPEARSTALEAVAGALAAAGEAEGPWSCADALDAHEDGAALGDALGDARCLRLPLRCRIGDDSELVVELWLVLAGAMLDLAGALVILDPKPDAADGLADVLQHAVVHWTALVDLEALRGARAVVVAWELDAHSGVEVAELLGGDRTEGPAVALAHPEPDSVMMRIAIGLGATLVFSAPYDAAELRGRLLGDDAEG